MSMRYSDYTVEQLREELAKLKEEALRAEQLGEINKLAIIERKMQMLASYQLHPEDFHAGEEYTLHGDPGYTFHINYLEGIMAWGYRMNLLGERQEKESALPISLLKDKVIK